MSDAVAELNPVDDLQQAISAVEFSPFRQRHDTPAGCPSQGRHGGCGACLCRGDRSEVVRIRSEGRVHICSRLQCRLRLPRAHRKRTAALSRLPGGVHRLCLAFHTQPVRLFQGSGNRRCDAQEPAGGDRFPVAPDRCGEHSYHRVQCRGPAGVRGGSRDGSPKRKRLSGPATRGPVDPHRERAGPDLLRTGSW